MPLVPIVEDEKMEIAKKAHLSDSESDDYEDKKKNKQKKKTSSHAPKTDDSATQRKKLKKTKKKDSDLSDSESDDVKDAKRKKKKKKDKKRKVSDESEISSLDGAVGMKKAKVEVVERNPNSVENFRISKVVRDMLKGKGIAALFPIQSMTFDIIFDGDDLVGRARTGQGKTLAFVLPILESLTSGPAKSARRTGYGRPPSVLVLLPTRELAKQVHSDFEVYGGALCLASCCVYGGAPYHSQEFKLKKGVDIVVGTPGRIKDHLERGNIDFSSLQFRVLDEADEMLKMGFVEHVEFILGKVEDPGKVQTLLFSATLPNWVKDIAARFLKPNKKIVDLVGNEKVKASTNVRHIALPCSKSARSQLIPDVIRCYSSGGRTIVFTETKESASELADILPGSRALHGDIQQSQREVTLSGFRSGKFTTLVATNVAARGLDINEVQLIIQCEPPRDVEDYIHRSGRTGRAGNTGVAVMLYDPRRSINISKIERESGVKFELVAAPQPADVAKAAGTEAAETISQVSDSVIPVFLNAAQVLLDSSELSAVEILAKALAKTTGYSEIKCRSLLSSMENYVTVLLQTGRSIYTPSFAFNSLRRFLPEEKVESITGLTLTADGSGAVFDVATEDLDLFLAGQEKASNVSIKVLEELPLLQERDVRGGRFGGDGGYSRGGRFGGGGGRFSSENGGGRRDGFSGRRNYNSGYGRGCGSQGSNRW